MKSSRDKDSSGTPPPPPAHTSAGVETGTEELIAYARRHFARDFPNAERDGCPPDEELRARVLRGETPDKRLRAHLFGCSECFGIYRSALASYERETRAVPKAAWWEAWAGRWGLGRAPVAAGLAALILLAGAGTYLWRRQQKEGGQLASGQRPEANRERLSPSQEVRPQRSDTPPPDNSGGTPQPAPTAEPVAPAPSRPPAQPRRTLPAMLSHVSVDLAQYAIARGAENASGLKAIKLPRLRTLLSLILPEGSRPGVYRLGIVDEMGKLLVRASKAVSRDGRTLDAVMDFERLAPKAYRLRVTHPAGFVEDYDVVIEDVKRALRPER